MKLNLIKSLSIYLKFWTWYGATITRSNEMNGISSSPTIQKNPASDFPWIFFSLWIVQSGMLTVNCIKWGSNQQVKELSYKLSSFQNEVNRKNQQWNSPDDTER